MTSFLEQYLKKAGPEDVTLHDFEAFLQQGIEEHQNLEYKPRGTLVRRDDSIVKSTNRWEVVGFSILAKVVAGFANAEGGLLVLGVEELEEKYQGTVIKKRPGGLSPLPVNVTREMIENQLQAKIKPTVGDLKIVPLYPDETHVIYLIDVPQSIRLPHRVDELFYYQRVNFSTLELQHFQIADLFGKRFAPDLDVTLKWGGGSDNYFV